MSWPGLLAFLEKILPKKVFPAVLISLVCGLVMYYLLAGSLTSAIFLASIFAALAGLSYSRWAYRDWFQLSERRKALRWPSLALLLLMWLGWTYQAGVYRSPVQRAMDRDMIEAQRSVDADPVRGVAKWKEAQDLATKLRDDRARQQCACTLGQLQESLGNQHDDARANLQLCLSLSKGTPAEAMADLALGQFEGAQGHVDAARKSYQDAVGAAQKMADHVDVDASADRALGDLAKNLGQMNDAAAFYQQALQFFHSEKYSKESEEGEADVSVGMGDLKLSQGLPADARDYYAAARKAYQELDAPSGEADVLVGLGNLESTQGNSDQARKDFGDAIGKYGQQAEGLANAKLGLGDLERGLGDSGKARGYLEDAYKSFASVNDNIGLTGVQVARAALETTLGNYQRAHDALKAATEFSYSYPLGDANRLDAEGDLATEEGKFDLARQDYVSAYDAYDKLTAPLGKATVKYGWGKLELKAGRFEAAQKDLKESRQIYMSENAKIGVADALLAYGDLEDKLKRYDEARNDYAEALIEFTGIGASPGIARTHLAIGNLEHDLGHNREGDKHYGTARGLFEQQGSLAGEADVDFADAKALAALPGQKVRAEDWLEAAYNLYCRIGNKDKLLEVHREQLKLGEKLNPKDAVCPEANPDH